MTTARVTLHDLTFADVDAAWAQMDTWRRQSKLTYPDAGMRAVRARDRDVLATLERIAEVLEAAHEAQRGETRRSARTYVEQQEVAYLQIAREAYRDAVEDRCSWAQRSQWAWIYGMAAYLAGVVT